MSPDYVNENCGICKLLPTETNPVTITPDWVVNLAPDQGYLGRCYVTSRRHLPSLSSVLSDQWLDFSQVVEEFESTAKRAFGAELFNWGCLLNDAYQVDPPAPHVHWHVRPRYRKPVEFAGQTFIDPNFGHHYDRDHKLLVDEATKAAIIAKLRVQHWRQG